MTASRAVVKRYRNAHAVRRRRPATFLAFGGEAATVSRTGYITAFARALSRRSDPPEIANDDHLADVFLLPVYRLLESRAAAGAPSLRPDRPGSRGVLQRANPSHRRDRPEQIAAGLDQLVVLGAGFDSRAMRFDAQLGEARVFEVDVADVIALKARHLAAAGRRLPPRVVQVAIDFSTEHLDKLLSHGFRPDARTLFLWEGVTTYLRDDDVSGVLRFVREHGGPGSTLVFDYVTRAFFEGDHSGYGSSPARARLAAHGKRQPLRDRVGARPARSLRPHRPLGPRSS